AAVAPDRRRDPRGECRVSHRADKPANVPNNDSVAERLVTEHLDDVDIDDSEPGALPEVSAMGAGSPHRRSTSPQKPTWTRERAQVDDWRQHGRLDDLRALSEGAGGLVLSRGVRHA